MFAKSFLAVLSVFAVAYSGVVANPISIKPTELTRRTDEVISAVPPSFNNYLGFDTMSNFDDFFGLDNFDSSFNEQVIIEQEEDLVCNSLDIQIVQQRLSILMEFAKRVILEQVCEVEVQSIVIEQFSSVFSSFQDVILRESDSEVGFDQNIAGLLEQLLNSDGSLSDNDLGFLGSSIGSNSVVVNGDNWNDQTSPQSVSQARGLAMEAANCTVSSDNSTDVSNSTDSSNSTSSS